MLNVSGRRRLLCLQLLLLWLALPAEALARCEIRPPLRPLPPPAAHEIVLATQNLWRFVDTRTDSSADKPVPEDYLARRLDDLARHVREVLHAPHLLAVQEVENLPLLERLAERIAAQGGPRYRTYLIEGLDPSGIDVGLLARAPVEIGSVTDLFREQRFNGYPLFSRPPLQVTVTAPLAMELLVVHLRSGRNLEDARRGKNVREKRRRQAMLVGEWLAAHTRAGVPAAVAGDLNSAPGDDLYAEPHRILTAGDALEVWSRLAPEERFSYVYRCRPQAIDNILLNLPLAARAARVAASRGNAGHQHGLYRQTAPRLVSDHDAVAVYLVFEGEAGNEGEDGKGRRGTGKPATGAAR